MNEQELRGRVEDLEKRVAELEVQAQAQPRAPKGTIRIVESMSVVGEVGKCGLKEDRVTASGADISLNS